MLTIRAPLSMEMETGEAVEILLSPSRSPRRRVSFESEYWRFFVVTPIASPNGIREIVVLMGQSME